MTRLNKLNGKGISLGIRGLSSREEYQFRRVSLIGHRGSREDRYVGVLER